jgi:hypothetical protein
VVFAQPREKDRYLRSLLKASDEPRVREPDFDEHRMLRTPARDVHVNMLPTGVKGIRLANEPNRTSH